MTRLLLVLLTCQLLPSLTQAEETSWQAGVATVVITPKESMWMAGYAARDKPSEGQVHDLYAKALAVEDVAGMRLVVVTTDLIGIPRDHAGTRPDAPPGRSGVTKNGIIGSITGDDDDGRRVRLWWLGRKDAGLTLRAKIICPKRLVETFDGRYAQSSLIKEG